MTAYSDSSFLFSLFVPDSNTAAACSLMKQATNEILITPLSVAETVNAMELHRFRGRLTESETAASVAAMDAAVAGQWLRLKPVPGEIWSVARRLSLAHTSTFGVRSLDILHVAAAVCLGATHFYTFDIRQARVAQAEGLQVIGATP